MWQVHDQYLIAPISGGIIVIDQHAAHERILYEETLRHLTDAPAVSQQLLFPRLLELSADLNNAASSIQPDSRSESTRAFNIW
ncbi:hypothetical protein ACFL6T_05945 [Candidatus Zixiibacteriota bacterium]